MTLSGTGAIVKVTKGAPHVLQALDKDAPKGQLIHQQLATLGEDGKRKKVERERER
jgi:hypothetical protein